MFELYNELQNNFHVIIGSQINLVASSNLASDKLHPKVASIPAEPTKTTSQLYF